MDSRNSVIGFIGLGAMGSRIAKRLVDTGFRVVAFDRTKEKKRALAA
jgi:3-hydroxyisobutyrate dehydrogenase-like beta-hydroxyacid dehydrogenase